MFSGERALAVLAKLAFPRVGGSPEEKHAADILVAELDALGLKAHVEEFKSWTYSNERADVTIMEPYRDKITAAAYGLSGSTPGRVTAPLVYVESGEPPFLKDVKGKVLLVCRRLNLKRYEACVKAGALGAICMGGPGQGLYSIGMPIEYVERTGKFPTVFTTFEDGFEIIKRGASKVEFEVSQDEFISDSRNVCLEIPGTGAPEDVILIGAHLDSVRTCPGAQDNAGGCATAVELARFFAENPPRRTLRFVWFGSEELGLRGSLHYVKSKKTELPRYRVMLNLDLAGGIVAENFARVMGSEGLTAYIDAMGKEMGIGLACEQSIYSSDCIPLGLEGVPSVNLLRDGGPGYYLHTDRDVLDYVDARHLSMLGGFALEVLRRFDSAVEFPFERTIPENVQKMARKYATERGMTDYAEK